jgi:hypothetical protein
MGLSVPVSFSASSSASYGSPSLIEIDAPLFGNVPTCPRHDRIRQGVRTGHTILHARCLQKVVWRAQADLSVISLNDTRTSWDAPGPRNGLLDTVIRVVIGWQPKTSDFLFYAWVGRMVKSIDPPGAQYSIPADVSSQPAGVVRYPSPSISNKSNV